MVQAARESYIQETGGDDEDDNDDGGESELGEGEGETDAGITGGEARDSAAARAHFKNTEPAVGRPHPPASGCCCSASS